VPLLVVVVVVVVVVVPAVRGVQKLETLARSDEPNQAGRNHDAKGW
jgi:hypothetical protein